MRHAPFRDTGDPVTYYLVLAVNGVFITATVAVCVVATCQLLQTQREILRQRAMGDTRHNSFAILTWHVIFYLICLVGSVSRIPYFVASCEGSFLAMHWTYWMDIYAFSFLLHWCGLVAIHTQRLRLVFDGTAFTTSRCYPATSAMVIAICVTALALTAVGIAFRIDAVRRVSVYLLITGVVGLIVTSKMIVGAFIAKFYQFNKQMTNFDIDNDGEAPRMMAKSTILAVISLISSVMAAISSVFKDDWYYTMSAHSLDMFVNCVCVYISLSMGAQYYDMLCGPLHRKCRECCVRMSRRKRKTRDRAISGSKVQQTLEPLPTPPPTQRTQTQTELEVPEQSEQIEVVSAEVLSAGQGVDTELEPDVALEAMRRMSRRISFNVNTSTMAHQIQRRSAIMTKQAIAIPDGSVSTKRCSVPIQSTLQIGVGVLAISSPDIVEFQGQFTVMDDEEEL